MRDLKDYSYRHYLASKKEVDDRSMNAHVWNTFVQVFSDLSCKHTKVIEVGAGLGTMLERLLERKVLNKGVYTAIDIDPINVAQTHQRLCNWARKNEFAFLGDRKDRFILQKDSREITVELKVADIFDLINYKNNQRKWDLLISHHFLDLIDLRPALQKLFSLIRPNGLFYFPLNFDGLTVFQPDIDRILDNKIVSLYHQTMNGRCLTGRAIYTLLKEAGGELLDAGSSDWVVFPRNGHYSADESYFLHCIVHTVYIALKDNRHLNQQRLTKWVVKRHEQINTGELFYIAHQLDFIGKLIDESTAFLKC